MDYSLLAFIGMIVVAMIVSTRFHSRSWPGRPGWQYQRVLSVGFFGLLLFVAGLIGWDLRSSSGWFNGAKWVDAPVWSQAVIGAAMLLLYVVRCDTTSPDGRRLLTKAILFAAALLVLDGRTVVAQSTDSRVPEAGDTSRHRLGMVTVNGVRVPYLDWGGSGPALVFIPGMGGTAHVFDEFAPMFVDQFRVVGVTRIGFGESDQPEREGYDLASRVAHIRAALDALGIARATLIGHSLGGDEITAFAVAHPERTIGLVYLDAAIDHTAALRWQQEFGGSYAPPPLGTRVQRATAETYRQYLRDIMGVEFPLGEVLAITRLDQAGLRRMRDTSKATAGIHANTVSPEFGKVQAPVLALYWDVSAQDAFPWLQGEAAERAASVYIGRQRPEMLIARQRFAAALKGARIAAYPGHHYEFLRAPDATARRVREFLSSLK